MEQKEKKGFFQERKLQHEELVRSVDLSTLPKPVNDVETSGPKKMKNFDQWPVWKNILVGCIGVACVLFLWWLYSYVTTDNAGKGWLSNPVEVWNAFAKMISNGMLWRHLGASLRRVLVGLVIAICTSIPVGFIMAWYKPVRAFLDPFIQFMRCIPPIAYNTIVVASLSFMGDEAPKYFIIWLAVFLTMTVTIYQGVKNIDLTLVKAAYTFGARDRNLFTGVIVPSAFPFILTAMRLGVGAAMTTLVAAEMLGSNAGLGSFIQIQGSNLQMQYVIMGILVLGFFGILLDKLLLAIEKRLTRWK